MRPYEQFAELIERHWEGIAAGCVAKFSPHNIFATLSLQTGGEEGGRWRSSGATLRRRSFSGIAVVRGVSSIAYRQLEEMMREREVSVDHSTFSRWVTKYAPDVEKHLRRRQRPVGQIWRVDETYVKIKGNWAYLYRAVDRDGQTVDFLLTPQRDRVAAETFLYKAIHNQGLPEKITIDQGGTNKATTIHYNRTHKTAIVIRQSKYLNDLVEQDHRAMKRMVRPMLGFKAFGSVRCTIGGIEVMHAIRKEQLVTTKNVGLTPAEQFYALAA